MNRLPFSPAAALMILAAAMPCATADDAAADQKATVRGKELFQNTILPVLQEHCYACHSKAAEATEGGLELDSRTGLLRGGDSGPMLKAHSQAESHLLRMLKHEDGVSGMPPEEKLPNETIAAFEEWIQLGAPDTREDTGPTAKEERLRKAQQHWSYRPPQVTTLPQVRDTAWPQDRMIDTFVLAAMEAEGLKPVDDASRRTLIRRLFFDLIGLPPSPQETEAFVADESPDAVELLVDRLLAMPQYGERWGRHWLDVARYAESSGMEFNFTYPHAWPYRDYVIDSFNADKPFDQFLREQIAGDLLPVDEKTAHAVIEARKVATSLLAFGPKRHNSSGTQFQMDMADDQIDVVFKSTMAMTVSCARCHDHKFDPIPTKDYYALAGIFLSTEPLYGTIKQKYSNTPTELLALGEDGAARHEACDKHDKAVAEAAKAVSEKQDALKKATDARKLAAKEKSEAEKLLAAVTARQNADEKNTGDTTDEIARVELKAAEEKLRKADATVGKLQAEFESRQAGLDDLKKTHQCVRTTRCLFVIGKSRLTQNWLSVAISANVAR